MRFLISTFALIFSILFLHSQTYAAIEIALEYKPERDRELYLRDLFRKIRKHQQHPEENNPVVLKIDDQEFPITAISQLFNIQRSIDIFSKRTRVSKEMSTKFIKSFILKGNFNKVVNNKWDDEDTSEFDPLKDELYETDEVEEQYGERIWDLLISEMPLMSNETILELLPKQCYDSFKGGIDKSWLSHDQGLKLFGIDQLAEVSDDQNDQLKMIYLKLWVICKNLDQEKRSEDRDESDLSSVRAQLSTESDQAPIFLEVGNDPSKNLTALLDSVSDPDKISRPVTIKYAGQVGIDAGGLRRHFFTEIAPEMGKLLQKLMQKEVESKEQEAPVTADQAAALGRVFARTAVVEQGIPGFAVNAPISLYLHLLGKNNFLEKLIHMIIYDSNGSRAQANLFAQSMAQSFGDFRDLYGFDETTSDEEIMQQIGCFKELLLTPELQGFLTAFEQIISTDKLSDLGITSPAQLRQIMEGRQIISKDQFLEKLEITGGTEAENKAYKKALEKIFKNLSDNLNDPDFYIETTADDPEAVTIDDKPMKRFVKDEQDFMRKFLFFATSSALMPSGNMALQINKDSASQDDPKQVPLFFAHTCFGTVDCPRISTVDIIKKRLLDTMKLVKDTKFDDI